MNNCKISKNNKGMSLVELLVAMAIFAAAIVPMLYAFVYSTGYNFKSQQTMQSTGIAQAIIEKCKGANTNSDDIMYALTNAADPADGILAGTQFDLTSGTITTSQSGNQYWIYNIKASGVNGESVDGGNASRRAYDVLVTFSPMDGGLTDHSVVQSMTSNSTANFGDSMCGQLKGFDAVAYGKVVDSIVNDIIPGATSNAVLPGGASASDYYDATDVNPARILLDRNIILTATDAGVNVKVEYYVSYDMAEDGTGTSSTFTLPTKTAHLSGVDYTLTCSGTLSDGNGHSDFTYSSGVPFYYVEFDSTPDDGFVFGPTNPVSDVFFYYYPGFLSSYMAADSPSFKDHFVIENAITSGNSFVDRDGATDKINFFIFKQCDDPVTGHGYYSNYDLGEKNYCPTIEMKDSTFDTYLYNNLLWSSLDGDYLAASGGSYANAWQHANMPVGTNCHNMTRNQDSHVDFTLADYYKIMREFDAPHTPSDPPQFSSMALADKAVLPYLSSDETVMFGSRFSIEVRVYPHGRTGFDVDEVEIMQAVVLNW